MTTNSYTLSSADALCRGRFGVPLNDKSIKETCRAALLRDADATIAQAVADNARLREALERIAWLASCAPNDDEIAAGLEFSKIMHAAKAALKEAANG